MSNPHAAYARSLAIRRHPRAAAATTAGSELRAAVRRLRPMVAESRGDARESELRAWICPGEVDYDRRCAAGLIPSFLNRCRSVLGCRLRILAAPLGPSMIPPVSCSTAMM